MVEQPKFHEGFITNAIADNVKADLQAAFPKAFATLRTEIQDGGLFLLIVADVAASVSRQDIENIIQVGGGLLTRRIPRRSDEYSWILNVNQHGSLVDSVSGGWNDTGANGASKRP